MTLPFTPSDLQAKAIKAIVAWYRDPYSPQVFYLAGYAGTGKSTVYAAILAALGLKSVITCAFTGKAANVLRTKGIWAAMTLHSAIYIPAGKDENRKTRFAKNSEGPAATADLIGLDECSMINDTMAKDLLSFGKKILVMGDPGQLPPINGSGYFTKSEPDFFLHEVHRQAAESPIIRLATMARLGQPIPVGDYGDDVRVMMLDRETQHEVYEPRTQALCGLHKTRTTIINRARARQGYAGRYPSPGEPLICRQNSSDLGIFNGSLGKAIQCDDRASVLLLDVKMDDVDEPLLGLMASRIPFDFHHGRRAEAGYKKGIHQFDFSNALTVHAAQGSQWPHVTVVDDSASFREARNQHLYTALTRPSDGLTLLKRSA